MSFPHQALAAQTKQLVGLITVGFAPITGFVNISRNVDYGSSILQGVRGERRRSRADMSMQDVRSVGRASPVYRGCY